MPVKKPTSRSAPAWAIGLATVFASVAASTVSVYVAARPEVQKYVESQDRTITQELEIKRDTTAGILNILASNAQQIGDLTSTLQKTTERVGQLEKELALTSLKLDECRRGRGETNAS